MVSRMRIVYFALVFGLVSLACSCTASEQYVGWGPDVRWVSVLPWYAEPPQEPLSLTTVLQVHALSPDIANHADWLTKVELDFGESLGWQDITQQFRASATPSSSPNSLDLSYTHTYAQAGSYTLRIRATYWDGEVVTKSEMHTNASFTITVPRDG